jgi:hypothetical protein
MLDSDSGDMMNAIEEQRRSPFAQTELPADRPVHEPPNRPCRFEPEDFSKAYRFPNQYLASHFAYETVPSPRKPEHQGLQNAMRLDELIASDEEGEYEEEAPSAVLESNFPTMVKIVRRQIAAQEAIRSALEEMAKHVRYRFVALLAGPFLQLNGIYVLKHDLDRIAKIWGEGPLAIHAEDVRSFWAYNLLTKQFEGARRRGFDPKIDAISF